MQKILKILLFGVLLSGSVFSQQFERIPIELFNTGNKKIQFREILTTTKGDMLILTTMGTAEIIDRQFKMDLPGGGFRSRLEPSRCSLSSAGL